MNPRGSQVHPFVRILKGLGIAVLLLLIPLLLRIPVEGSIIILGFCVIWFILQGWRNQSFRVSRALLFFLLLFLYQVVFAQFSKPIPAAYLHIEKTAIYALLAFLASTAMRSTDDRDMWEDALIILGILSFIFSGLELSNWYQRLSLTADNLKVFQIPVITYRLHGMPFNHPNVLGGIINFVWPIVLIRLVRAQEIWKRLFYALLLVFSFVTMFYTNSRGAWVGAVAGFGFLMLILFLSQVSKVGRNVLSVLRRFAKIILPGLLGISLIIVIVFLRAKYSGSQGIGLGSRTGIWTNVWHIFLEAPIIGSGIGSVPIGYIQAAHIPPGFLAPHAHNLWLQVAVEYGLVGFLLLNLAILVLLFRFVKTIRLDQIRFDNPGYAYLAGVAALLAQHLFDYMLMFPRYMMVALVVFLLVERYGVPFDHWRVDRLSYTEVFAVAIALVSMVIWINGSKMLGFADYQETNHLAKEGQWVQAKDILCQAADQYEENALYQFKCSLAIAHQLDDQGTGEEGPSVELLDQAVHYQEAGIETNPYWSVQAANLAALYWAQGVGTRAIELMRTSAEFNPRFPPFILTYAWMQEQVGAEAAAEEYYTRAIVLDPMVIKSAFAQNSDLFRSTSEEIVSGVQFGELSPEWFSRWPKTIYNFETWKGVLALGVDQYELAIPLLEASLGTDPGSIQRYADLALAHQLNGDGDRAADLARIIQLLLSNGNVTRDPYMLSIAGSILRQHGESDLAYELLLEALNTYLHSSVYGSYYKDVYGQYYFSSDLSPFLITSQHLLTDLEPDWRWLAAEAQARGDEALAGNVEAWLQRSQGVPLSH